MTTVTNTIFQEQTIAERLSGFQRNSMRRAGQRNAYLALESQFETMARDGELNTSRSTVAASDHSFRLTMKFEDKSCRHFSLIADNYEVAVEYAPHLVQEIVEHFGFQRVVWNLEGQSYHFASCDVDIDAHPSSIVGKFKRSFGMFKNFFFMDEYED